MNSANIVMDNRSNDDYWQREELWAWYLYIYILYNYICILIFLLAAYIYICIYVVTKSWYIVIKKCRSPGEDGVRHKASHSGVLIGGIMELIFVARWLDQFFTAQEVCNGRPGRHFYLVLVTLPLLFGNFLFFFQGLCVYVWLCMTVIWICASLGCMQCVHIQVLVACLQPKAKSHRIPLFTLPSKGFPHQQVIFVRECAEETGQSFVTEFKDGSVSWLCNPSNLEDRNSLAKLLFQADCKDTNLSTSKECPK